MPPCPRENERKYAFREKVGYEVATQGGATRSYQVLPGATRCYQVPPAIFIENLNIQCAVSDMLDIQIVHSWLKNALNLIPVMYFDPAGSALSIGPFVEED